MNEVIAAVGAGAAGSWSINNLGPRMIKRDFNPGFFVDHISFFLFLPLLLLLLVVLNVYVVY